MQSFVACATSQVLPSFLAPDFLYEKIMGYGIHTLLSTFAVKSSPLPSKPHPLHTATP